MSSTGVTLRLECPDWSVEMVDAELDNSRVLSFLVSGEWLVDGRRWSGSTEGEWERMAVGGERGRVEEVTAKDMRWAWSALRILLMSVMGRWATEAERGCMAGHSAMGDVPVASSMTLGRPAKAYDTRTAMSQDFPLFHRETDRDLAFWQSLVMSWMTTSS